VAYSGAWTTVPDDDMITAVTSDNNSLLYEFILEPGTTLAPGTYEFATQYNHAQGYRDAGSDTYQVTATAADNQVELSGSFSGTDSSTARFRSGSSGAGDSGQGTSQSSPLRGPGAGGRRAVSAALFKSPILRDPGTSPALSHRVNQPTICGNFIDTPSVREESSAQQIAPVFTDRTC
jgi:hypothetical protein